MVIINKLFFITLFALFIDSTVFAETSNNTTPSAAAPEAGRAADLEAIRPMAEAMGLTAEELEARNNTLIKVKMSLPHGFMEQMEADPSYADTWVQQQPKAVMYITFSGDEGYQRGKALVATLAAEFGGFWVDYVEVQKANISKVEINKLRDKIDSVLRTNGVKFQSSTGHEDNTPDAYISIEVMEPVKSVADVLLKAGIKLSPFVKIIQIPEFGSSFSSIYGGWSLYDPAAVPSGKPYNCTIGFAVKNSAGLRGVSTTAHCSDILSTKGDGTVLKPLTFKSQKLDGSYDVQWHTAPVASFTVTNLVKLETARVTSEFPHTLQGLGDMVCKYGIITARTCGKITSLAALHTPLEHGASYPNNKATYFKVTCNAGTTNCSLPGDSGSPVYSKFTIPTPNLIAYGLMVGGAPALNYFVYMPIDYISTLGISVLTSP